MSYVMLHATDERGINQDRGYEATTSLFEPALIGEYYFVRNRERNSFLFQTYRGSIKEQGEGLLQEHRRLCAYRSWRCLVTR
ncbi:MAG: hypothetical protein MZV63_54710 [Marinilabiliales bacterium]|nr:hypothetical protein [Marinilabiliales bacterium]